MAEHGTTTSYKYGCRCEDCKAAMSRYQRSRYQQKQDRRYLASKIEEDRARQARMAEIAARRADWDALFADALKTADAAKPAGMQDEHIETGFEDLV